MENRALDRLRPGWLVTLRWARRYSRCASSHRGHTLSVVPRHPQLKQNCLGRSRQLNLVCPPRWQLKQEPCGGSRSFNDTARRFPKCTPREGQERRFGNLSGDLCFRGDEGRPSRWKTEGASTVSVASTTPSVDSCGPGPLTSSTVDEKTAAISSSRSSGVSGRFSAGTWGGISSSGSSSRRGLNGTRRPRPRGH